MNPFNETWLDRDEELRSCRMGVATTTTRRAQIHRLEERLTAPTMEATPSGRNQRHRRCQADQRGTDNAGVRRAGPINATAGAWAARELSVK